VQAHAAEARAALAQGRGQILGVDAVAEAQHALAGAPARGDAARDRGREELGEERLRVRQRIRLHRVDARAEAAVLEEAGEPPRHLTRDPRHLGVVGGRERVEARGAAGPGGVDAVEHEGMEVDVQVQGVPEALHERDGPAPFPRHVRWLSVQHPAARILLASIPILLASSARPRA